MCKGPEAEPGVFKAQKSDMGVGCGRGRHRPAAQGVGGHVRNMDFVQVCSDFCFNMTNMMTLVASWGWALLRSRKTTSISNSKMSCSNFL